MKIYLDNNLGVTKVEQEELTQDTYGYNILKVYIPNAVLTPYDTFTCYYGALLQNGRKVGWFAMEARTSSDADYEENYTLYKATLEQCVVSVEGKVYIGCQVLLGNSGNATLIKKNTAVVQFNVRKSVAINNDILVLDPDQTNTDVLESYKNLLENALTTYATKATTYTKTEVNSALALKADKSNVYTKDEVDTKDLNLAGQIAGARVELNNRINTTDGILTATQAEVAKLKSVQNVVEVVATKSALNSYDTTKLDVNDKVQVIADETHDGASTIYNWSGSAWQYVGAYGTNSYTKQESDNKFAPKATAVTHSGNQLQDYGGNNIYPNLADGQVKSDKIASKLKSTLLELQDYANSSKLDGYYNQTTFTSSATRYTLVYDVTNIEKVIVKGNFYQYSNSYTLFANNVIVHYNTEYGNNKEFSLDVSDSDTLCVTAHADTIASIQVKALLIKNYTQVNANTNNIDYLTTISKGLERMYPSGYISNKYYSNGTLSDTASRDLCVYDLTNIDKVIIKGTSIQYVNEYTFLDANNTPVKYHQATTSGTAFEYIIDCTNYSKLAVSVNYTINSPSQSTFYTYVYKYNNFALCNPRDDSHLKNRNIIWLGTSIPAGGTLGLDQPYSYPNILGKLLGCNMYNESVGSSCLHCRQTTLVDADTNPYGFVSSFQTASRCLTNTLTMMEWIINWIDYRINGGTYQNEGTYNPDVFTSSLPSTFTSTDADFIRSCSYENKVDKYLNSTSMKPDMFVIDHAHNDAPYNDSVWDESNPYSTFSYKGAVLFLLNHIYSKYPRIKILFMGHYENTYKSYIAEEQEIIATYTNTEIFKLWEKLPFSYNVKCETTGYWYANYGLWVDSGGTEQTIRMYNLWLRDGMHPHTDFTHRTERYIAEVIYPYINNVVIYNPIRNVNTAEGE